MMMMMMMMLMNSLFPPTGEHTISLGNREDCQNCYVWYRTPLLIVFRILSYLNSLDYIFTHLLHLSHHYSYLIIAK